VRRSLDNGTTWSADAPVSDAGDARAAAGNPMAVFHAPSGRVIVVFGMQRLPARGCSPGAGVFVVDDGGSDGAAWTAPRNISGDLGGLARWGAIVPGPGTGAVLRHSHAGRIVMSGTHDAYGQDIVFFSDDGGATWAPGATPLARMDESGVAELSDGAVYVTLRNARANASCACQAHAVSTDGGATFAAIEYDADLPSPVCQAAVASVDDRLYFSNPADTRARANITVRRSAPRARAGAVVWEEAAVLVAPGLTWGGYSSLVVDRVASDAGGAPLGGILFERNTTTAAGAPVNVISFALFPLDF